MWLNDLLANDIQIVWATTWIDAPVALAELAEQWGLPTNLPRILSIDRDEQRANESGKRPGVERWLTDNNVDATVTPVVWLDDALGVNDVAWAKARGIEPVVIPDELGIADSTWQRYVDDALRATSLRRTDRATLSNEPEPDTSESIDPDKPVGNYFFSLKCFNCSLHYVVMSWYPQRHVDRNATRHFCPECGAQRSIVLDVISGPVGFLPFPYHGPLAPIVHENAGR
jgi:hypothetical protein